MPIEVTQARARHDRPGPRPRGLLPRRHAAVRRPGPVLARRRQPAGRQRRRAPPRSSAPTWGRSCASPSRRVVAVTGRRDRAEGRRRGAAGLDVVRGVEPATCSRSATSSAARGSTSRWPAASTCPRCSAAARPTRSARSAASTAARCRPATSCRRVARATARPGGRCPRTLRPDLPSELEIRVVMGLYDHLLTDDGRRDVPRDDLDAHAGRRPRRLPLQGRRARHGRARAAVRRGQRPVEHRRRAVPDRLDPGARRRRADRPAPRRGLRRRLRDDRDRHQRRHGRRRASPRPARRRASSPSTSRPRSRRGASAPSASPGWRRRSAREADGYVVISAGAQCATARRLSIARNCPVVVGNSSPVPQSTMTPYWRTRSIASSSPSR